MKILNVAVLSTTLTLGLVACSGGSSENANDQPTPTNSKISPDNASEVIEMAFDSFENLDFISREVQGGNFVENARNADRAQKSGAKPVVFCGSNPFSDTGSGSMDVTANGDFATMFDLSIEFAQCQLTTTAIIDGAYNLNFSGDLLLGPQFSDGMSVTTQTFTNLTVNDTENSFNALANGEIATTIEFDSSVLSISESVNLMLAENNNEIVFSGWQKNIMLDFENEQLSLNISGDFSATSENGSFTLEMLAPLTFEVEQQNNNANPTAILSGQFKITAEDNSSVTVTIISSTEAQLEIDEDGDGTIDSTVTVSIDELKLFNSAN